MDKNSGLAKVERTCACRVSVLLLILISLLVPMAFASKPEAKAASLIEHAKQLSDIRTEGAPPFRLKLDVKISREDGTVIQGAYTETWVSKARWRKETVLGDFHRIQIAEDRKRWLLDNSTVVPEGVEEISSLSDMSRFRPELWKTRKERKVKGVTTDCLESNFGPSMMRWTVCFDKASGALAAEIRPIQLGNRRGERLCSYSDYQKFGDRILARSYECGEDNRPRIEARIVELASQFAQDPALFAQPAGAKESVNCIGSIKAPKVVYQQEPKPPQSFHGSNLVVLSIVVGTDGMPHDLRVTSAPNPDYDAAALEAVAHWRFNAATCDGEPMETEITVETEFHRY